MKSYIFRIVQDYMMSLPKTISFDGLTYNRAFYSMKALYDDCKFDKTDEDELKIYRANILFSSIVNPKIESILTVVSDSYLRKMTDAEIIEAFFHDKSSL